VIGAIAIKGIRRTRSVGERHIGVWPQQIDGVARQAGRLPAENMQRHVVTGAPSRQFGAGRAIDIFDAWAPINEVCSISVAPVRRITPSRRSSSTAIGSRRACVGKAAPLLLRRQIIREEMTVGHLDTGGRGSTEIYTKTETDPDDSRRERIPASSC
jgi:hypothetical protein